MRRITAVVSLSLDGVMQAPGRPDEDRRGGFEHGGGAVPYNDHVMMQGRGQRLFGDDAPRCALRLVDSTTTTKGVVIATYHPDAGPVTEAR